MFKRKGFKSGGEKLKVNILDNLINFVGLVASDTSLDILYFEVIQESDLEEGRLVEVYTKEKPVLYQIIDGLTKEEIVYKKNTSIAISGPGPNVFAILKASVFLKFIFENSGVGHKINHQRSK